jgi:hypothetical protein
MAIEIYRGAALVASFETRGGREFASFYGGDGAELRALLEPAPERRVASWAARVPGVGLGGAGHRAVTKAPAAA